MSMEDIIQSLNVFFEKHISPIHRITSIVKKEEQWEARVEVIEEKEYMKKYGRDQIIGVYVVQLDENLDIISFERIHMRPRTATRVEEIERG
ncbi:Gas vesicle synthesis protein GvpO [Alteribacillus iranensis]|uniref:Gas vesicle synthesis protein GvpO n=2 Tax=Alteribacillus iranensis TaxID=930128 RepID=A0A1I2EJB0_9BACI|nr:Gas vesicle synthesis protein GvpO [Alteribacillus iranensis]